MMHRRELEGDEWSCLTCGHISYGPEFQPIHGDENGERERRRQPSHGKTRL